MMASLRLVILVVALCTVGSVVGKPRTVVVNTEDNDVNPEKQVQVKAGGVEVAVDVGASPAVAVDVGGNPSTPFKPTTVVVQKPVNPNLYNDIFNIPTSILSAVNRLLTNGAASLGFGGGGSGGTKVTSSAGASAGTGSTGGTGSIGARIGADGDKADAGGSASVAVEVNKPPVAGGHGNNFFDNIFNIPISALNAVNQLLNNNHRGRGN